MSIWNKIWPIPPIPAPPNPIPAPPNPVRIGENKIKDEIEDALKNDLNTDALKIIDSLASNRLGQDVLNYINTLKQGNDLKDVEWAVDAAGKNFWSIDSIEINLINKVQDYGIDLLRGAEAPTLKITPSLIIKNVSFLQQDSSIIGSPQFDYNDLEFTDSQDLNLWLSANIDMTFGVQLEITTFDKGDFVLPISLGGNNLKSTGSKTWGKFQESEGVFSLSAGLGLKGGLTVGEPAANQTFDFSFSQPIRINVIEDVYLKLSESVNAGSIWNAAKQFMSDPSTSASAERDLIKSGNEFDANAGILNESPAWLFLEGQTITQPDSLTGLDGFFELTPSIMVQLGLILKEIGDGVNIGSLDLSLDFANKLSFGSDGQYDFTLSADAGVTGLGVSFGPAYWSAFHKSLADENWALVDVLWGSGAVSTWQPG